MRLQFTKNTAQLFFDAHDAGSTGLRAFTVQEVPLKDSIVFRRKGAAGYDSEVGAIVAADALFVAIEASAKDAPPDASTRAFAGDVAQAEAILARLTRKREHISFRDSQELGCDVQQTRRDRFRCRRPASEKGVLCADESSLD